MVGVLDDSTSEVVFQYAPDFVRTQRELSPLAAPLSTRSYQGRIFNNGLPGFIADSLPDGWGNLLLDRQLRRHGRRLEAVSPLERLCWVGSQGMGALEYEPETSIAGFQPDAVVLDALALEAGRILEQEETSALDILSSLNGSSGGARPKIVCLVDENKICFKRGTEAEDNFSPWLIKFRSSYDPKDQGVHEYICSRLAAAAGIDVPETHLFESRKGKGWFGSRRFDRTSSGKLHMVTAAGLLDCNFREPCLDWESVLALTQRLAGSTALLEQFRRCVFSYMIGNSDDHAKNFSFLMNRTGQWRTAPFYDCVPDIQAGAEHMTAVLGRGSKVERRHFLALAAKFDIDKFAAIKQIDRIAEAVSSYGSLAATYGVKVPASVRPF